MTETYLISIMERLGGDSSNVGTALFISSISGAPVIFFYSFFRKRIKKETLLKISALTFLLKAVLFCIAPAIGFVYALEVLQTTSYGFLGPTQVYFAGSRVRPADMVKGQAFVTAAYSLGCSGGNFAGGQLLNFGVETMLIAGIGMALAGTLILFLTLNKTDF
jgi:PPP family 3-phenylpropionic acid transporter